MTRGIFYIGSHKTGSSTLQEYLSLNSHKLLSQGHLYPFVDPSGIAYSLAKAALDKHVIDLPLKIRAPHNGIAYKILAEHIEGYRFPHRYSPVPSSAMIMKMVCAMMEQSEAHTLLLCSEIFSQFGIRAPSAIGQLIERSGVDQASVYMVLRRPDLLLASWQSQVLKMGSRRGRLSNSSIKRFVGTCFLDFYKSVEPWCAYVGDQNLCLVNYADLRAQGGSIKHFTAEYGIQIDEPTETKVHNTGLPYAMYETVRKSNAALAGKKTDFRNWCINNSNSLDLPPNSEVELFGEKNRRWLVKYFKRQNRQLGRFIGKEVFFPDLDEALITRRISEDEASELGFNAVRSAYLEQPIEKQNAVVVDWLRNTTRLRD